MTLREHLHFNCAPYYDVYSDLFLLELIEKAGEDYAKQEVKKSMPFAKKYFKEVYDEYEKAFNFREKWINTKQECGKESLKQILIYIIGTQTKLRRNAIARLFGYKSHSSIYIAINDINELKKNNKRIERVTNKLLEEWENSEN